MTLIFATNNAHKIAEIKAALGNAFHIITLEEAGIRISIPEPHDTLEANAREKSTTIFKLTGKDCFAEDTGLEVRALQGAPGVKSARYAGEHSSQEDNISKLLQELKGKQDRTAQFRTVISLLMKGKEYQFEGVCKGRICFQEKGNAGFGYDPVFIPEGAVKTFAEMEMEEKNQYSHRMRALQKLITFLKTTHQ